MICSGTGFSTDPWITFLMLHQISWWTLPHVKVKNIHMWLLESVWKTKIHKVNENGIQTISNTYTHV